MSDLHRWFFIVLATFLCKAFALPSDPSFVPSTALHLNSNTSLASNTADLGNVSNPGSNASSGLQARVPFHYWTTDYDFKGYVESAPNLTPFVGTYSQHILQFLHDNILPRIGAGTIGWNKRITVYTDSVRTRLIWSIVHPAWSWQLTSTVLLALGNELTRFSVCTPFFVDTETNTDLSLTFQTVPTVKQWFFIVDPPPDPHMQYAGWQYSEDKIITADAILAMTEFRKAATEFGLKTKIADKAQKFYYHESAQFSFTIGGIPTYRDPSDWITWEDLSGLVKQLQLHITSNLRCDTFVGTIHRRVAGSNVPRFLPAGTITLKQSTEIESLAPWMIDAALSNSSSSSWPTIAASPVSGSTPGLALHPSGGDLPAGGQGVTQI